MVDLDGELALAGCTLRYTDSRLGRGPVVLLHGAGADHTMFTAQRTALIAAGFRVILLDLRGHGCSRPNSAPLTSGLLADDLDALSLHLDLAAPVLVGHSLGGNLAQFLVRRAPDRCSALVVLGATWNAGPLTAGEKLALGIAAPVLRLLPAHTLRRMMADASATTGRARAELVRTFSTMSKVEFLSAWRATTQFVAPDPGYRTPVPLLLLRGAEDVTGNIATAMPRWAAAEGVAEVVVPGAGHVLTLDAPEAVSDALLAFLASTGGRHA